MGSGGGTGRALIICSVLEVIGLAIWVGGLIVIIVAVIPSVFNVGMETGGRVLTHVFEGYNRLVGGVMVVLAGSVAWRLWMMKRRASPAARVSGAELTLLILMIGIAAALVLWLSPLSGTLQEQAFAAEGEAAQKAAYQAFFQLHQIARALYVVNLLLGLALIAVKVRGWMRGIDD